MCGICGKIYHDTKKVVRERYIRKMIDTMQHRGPDDEGIYTSKFVGLGHKRLSIIDLNTGKQPMCNENGQIWIVYNGEIYNFVELRSDLQKKGHIFKTKTDTEVILHLYEELEEGCLSKLRGMFSFAIWDCQKRKLFIARDRVGIKPLYYTITRDGLIFASEIKALLEDESVDRSVCPKGLGKFLTYYYTPGPETMFENIYKLQPGHYLLMENGDILVKEYWDIVSSYSANNLKVNDLEDQLINIIQDSVKGYMISDVPVGFLLSGGVDSTGLLYFASTESNSQIKSFTIGFEGQDFSDERYYARLAARKYGIEHYETTITGKEFFDFIPKYIWYMEEPICEPPGIALYFVSKMAKDYVKVLISGEGGDEAFAGYQTYRNLVWLERLKRALGPLKIPIGKMISYASHVLRFSKLNKYAPLINIPLKDYYYSRTANPFSYFNINLHNLYIPAFENKMNMDSSVGLIKEYFERSVGISELNKMLYIDTKTWLPDDLLIKADKMTMANSLELRVPLLDHTVLEFAASLPSHYKLNGMTTKYILKKVLSSFVPSEIIKRKKTGFPIPYERWLHNEYRGAVFEILMDSRSTERGYFEKAFIKNLLEKEWVGTGRYPKEIFSLLCLELWHRIFIDCSGYTI